MVLKKLDIHLQKDESKPLPLTIDKNQLKVDQRSKPKTSNYKTAPRKHYYKTAPRKHWGNSGRYWIDKNFLSKIPKAQAIIPQIDRWDYIRLRSFCTAKDTIISVKRQLKEGR